MKCKEKILKTRWWWWKVTKKVKIIDDCVKLEGYKGSTRQQTRAIEQNRIEWTWTIGDSSWRWEGDVKKEEGKAKREKGLLMWCRYVRMYLLERV